MEDKKAYIHTKNNILSNKVLNLSWLLIFLLCRSNASWETIFSKSTDSIDETELNCCRRIVQLCKDCLLIVYQFAAEAKTAAQGGADRSNDGPNEHRYTIVSL